MRDASRIAYAQARVQARFSERPPDAFWRELEAGRDLQRLMEIARTRRAGKAVESIAATHDPHVLEHRLARHWAQACDEIAGWYPDAWHASMRWLAWLPWLPVIAWLSRALPTPAWMQGDDLVGQLARLPPEERPQALSDVALRSLFAAGGDASPATAWHRHWRETWPVADSSRQQRGLERLDAVLDRLTPGEASIGSAGFDTLVDVAQAAATRVFRRLAGTPVAGMALLVLLALDQVRLRAALALARSFGPGGPP